MSAISLFREVAKLENWNVRIARKSNERRISGEGLSISWRETVVNGYKRVYYCETKAEFNKKEEFKKMIHLWLSHLEKLSIEEGCIGVIIEDGKKISYLYNSEEIGYTDFSRKEYDDRNLMQKCGLSSWTGFIYKNTGSVDYLNQAYPAALAISKLFYQEQQEDPTFSYDSGVASLGMRQIEFRFRKLEKRVRFQLHLQPSLRLEYDGVVYLMSDSEKIEEMVSGWIRETERKQKMKHLLTPPREEFDAAIKYNYHDLKRVANSIHSYFVEKYDPYELEKWMHRFGRSLDFIEERFYHINEAYKLYRIMNTYLIVKEEEDEDLNYRLLLMTEDKAEAQKMYCHELGEAKKREMELKFNVHMKKIEKRTDKYGKEE